MSDYSYRDDGQFIGLGGKLKPVPCSDRALKLAAAVLGVVNTQAALEEAYDRVPDYTAQHDPEDYYAEEQDKFYRACEKLERVLGYDDTIYDVGDYVELNRNQLGRWFGIVDSVTPNMVDTMVDGEDTVVQNGYTYKVALLNEKGLKTERLISCGLRAIKGLSDRKQHYAAHVAKELAPLK